MNKYNFEFYRFSHSEKNNTTEKIGYNCQIKLLLLGVKGNSHFYKIATNKFSFLGGENSRTHFAKCMNAVFSSLILSVDTQGKITQVFNFSQIRQKWKKLYSIFLKDNKGEVMESIYEQMEKLCSDKEEFINHLQRYEMFGLLFGKHRLPRYENTSEPKLIDWEDTNYKGRFIHFSQKYMEGYVTYPTSLGEKLNSLLRIG